MANVWGTNPIILDTASDDVAYDATHDVVNGGTEYSSMRYKVKSIAIVGAANGQNLVLKACKPSAFAGTEHLNVTVETGDLRKTFEFGNGVWFQGINPTTIAGGKFYIYLA